MFTEASCYQLPQFPFSRLYRTNGSFEPVGAVLPGFPAAAWGIGHYFTCTSGPLEAFQTAQGNPQKTAPAVSDNLFVLYKRLKGARGRWSHVVPVK
jgi:hypothetical protein